jgi:dTDP-4-amino-4,6-dideoxygalactose transaminase
MSAIKPISISLSPNTEKDDVRLALKTIFKPWSWKKGRAVLKLEEEFKKYLGVKYAFSFNSGRSALLAILKALDLKKGEEVLAQAFTCNAAVNPIIWSGLKPVYLDCDEDTFNIDPKDLLRKITPKSKVVMIQHTFGLPAFASHYGASAGKPAEINEVLEICRKNNLILIEDCAHALGAEYNGQKVGAFGKAGFFSFSRDKVISSIYGGMAVTNDSSLAKRIQQAQDKFGYPSFFWVFQQLLHPILVNWIVLPIYNFLDLGKIFLILSQWLHLLSKAVHRKEKRGEKPAYFPKSLPNGLALLVLNQFKKLDKFYQHRQEISKFYYEALKNSSFGISENLSPEILKRKNIKHSFLRFTIKHKKAHEIIYQAWNKKNILIGDWYTSPIAPDDTNLEKMSYRMGMCPKAEKLSKITLNLPTHINISPEKAQKIINFLKKF